MGLFYKLQVELFLFTIVLTACSSNTPTPPVIYADTFFSGCAYLDVNQNEKIDESDTPIAQAAFSIRLPQGAGFGDRTGDSGCTSVIIPAALDEKFYPVEAWMKPPEGTDLESITKQPVILNSSTKQARFLFRKK